MSRNQRRLLRLGISILGTLTLTSALLGQASTDSKASAPVINDWSHHRVVFSKPANAEQAKRVQQDPRYWQQLALQSPTRLPEATSDALPSDLHLDSDASLPSSLQLNRDWSEDLGTGASVGAGNFPMKYSFGITSASCTDFVVYGTGLSGSTGQASVVAYSNLYIPSCGTVPTVYWAYNTGGTILTSPVPSFDGTQVAYVQRDGTLVLLKWAASTLETASSPMTLVAVSGTAYRTCTAPCMTTVDLRNSGGVGDLDHNSSIFYDYGSDSAYVGDDSDFLHKFTPVFNGVLAEVRTGAWPVQVNATTPTALSSPVHDPASGNVFVGDAGGFLYLVNSSTGGVTVSGQLDFSGAEGGSGIVDSPMVDSTAGLVYVFASSDGTTNCTGGAACAAVYELTTSFATGSTGSKVMVGASTKSGTAPNSLHDGDFDSTYKNSGDATGNLYVCGETGGVPILYQVAITAGAFSAATGTALTPLSSSTVPCSPVTDILNPNVSTGPTEWIFASAQVNGVSTPCISGCIFNFNVTPWKPSTVYTIGQEVLGLNADGEFQIEVVSSINGTDKSGTVEPAWTATVGATTTDNKVHWLNQTPLSAFTPAAWAANTKYAIDAVILDPNGNIEWIKNVAGAGKSGATIPTFKTVPNAATIDGGVVWRNLGAIGTAAMSATGGTSGIIIDNTVSSGTEAGASQVYFSTLGNQACTGGTGGCAVQASQSALQ